MSPLWDKGKEININMRSMILLDFFFRSTMANFTRNKIFLFLIYILETGWIFLFAWVEV